MDSVGLAPPTASPQPAWDRLRLPAFIDVAWFRHALGIGLLAGLYYGTAQLGYALSFTGPVAAIVWLPVGVGISFLYRGGLRYWPGLVIGDLLANNYSALPVGSAVGQTTGNVLEVLVAVLLIRRLIGHRMPLCSVGGLARLLLAIAAGTAVSATVGLLSLRLGGVVSTSAIPKLWRTWWLGDACGALLVVPLVLAWSTPSLRPRMRGRVLEAVLAAVLTVGLSTIAFRSGNPLPYLVFPALIWVALRFGWCGATAAVFVAASYAIWGTTHYKGPFAFGSLTNSVLETQAFVVVASLSSLYLAAVVWERQGFADRLRASHARLAETADIERKRIERNLHDGAQQRLTALAVYLEIAAEQARLAPNRAPALFARAERDLLLAIDELRQLAHGVQPPMLTRFGLGEAIERVAAHSTVPIEFVELPTRRFDPAAEAAGYYVLVEAITNAQKYSRASSVRVRASWASDVLNLEIADDGVGGANEKDGFGLQGLHDRVDALGGELVVDSAVGEGTRIRAAIPALAS
jgi:signal transduction histidine kinase